MDISKVWENVQKMQNNPFASEKDLYEFLMVNDQIRNAMINRGDIKWV